MLTFCLAAILLGSLRLPHQDLKRWILEIDENHLTEGMIQSLLKNLPEPEQINGVYQLKEEYEDMAEAEQFCVTVSRLTGFSWGPVHILVSCLTRPRLEIFCYIHSASSRVVLFF